MAYKNKEDQYACQKRWYKRNKKTHIANVKEDRKARLAWLLEYKKSLQCSKCLESDSRCLDFHHLDPTKKSFNLGEVGRICPSKERILEEIDKCIVLCANCHRKVTFDERVGS